MSRIDVLAKEIIKHRDLYYNRSPIISDSDFDFLCDELRGLDPNNEALTSVGAPITPNTEWEKGEHQIPMGSLDKASNPEEINDWAGKTLKPNSSVFITEKLDGISIEVRYENGKFVSALTRGDGRIGEEIGRNVVKMGGIKPFIKGLTASLRGEIILRKTQWKKHFPEYSNPRNCASGISKRIDGEGSEHLDVLFYQVIGETENLPLGDFKSEYMQFQFIEQTLGLNTPHYEALAADSGKELCAYVNRRWEEYHTTRNERDYDLDGLVVRVNDLPYQIELGDKDMRPKGAIAYKFVSEKAATTVLDIISQTGDSGRITPVVVVKTVRLAGADVSRASLYNFAYIKELGLDIGAEVLLARAGDVIPRCEKVIKGTGTIFKTPTSCPSCGGKLEAHGEHLMCVSTDTCPAQIVGRLKNWVSSLNLLEWGETLLTKLVEAGLASTVVDLYMLRAKDLAALERMGEKSANKCISILWAHNPIPLELILGSLSIPMIGTSMIKLVMDAGYDNLDKIMSAEVEDFAKIKGMGLAKSESLYNGLIRNRDIVKGLLKAGVVVQDKVFGKLSGKSLCFTGKMTNKRKDLEDMVIKNGGEVKSVGRSLSYLVIDDVNSSTSKATAAKKLGTKLISEQDFLKMVEDA